MYSALEKGDEPVVEPAVPPRRLPGNGSFLELAGTLGRGGKGASQGDVLVPSPEGSVPCVPQSVRFWAQRSPDAGTAGESFPGELGHLQSEGSPHRPTDLQPSSLSSTSPLALSRQPPRRTPPLLTNPSGLTQASGLGVMIRSLLRTGALITRGRGPLMLLVLLQSVGRRG